MMVGYESPELVSWGGSKRDCDCQCFTHGENLKPQSRGVSTRSVKYMEPPHTGERRSYVSSALTEVSPQECCEVSFFGKMEECCI